VAPFTLFKTAESDAMDTLSIYVPGVDRTADLGEMAEATKP